MEEENNQTTENTFYGILDKYQILKEPRNRQLLSYTLSIIKTSNDQEIARLSNLIMNDNKNKTSSDIIGLRKAIKIVQKETSTTKLEIYDYNYLLAKKFKYLSEEAILRSDILVIAINIFDKKCLDNLKLILNDIVHYSTGQVANNDSSGNNIAFSTTNENILDKKIKFILIKSTNNFLMKIIESTALINTKTEISNLFKIFKELNYKFVEVDIDDVKETNNLINELIN